MGERVDIIIITCLYTSCVFCYQPPTAMFCNFQTSRYLLSYSDGNTTWFTEPKTISHSSQLVKVGIDTGLKVDTYYTITVTILTDAGNISSTTNFSELMLNSVYSHGPLV